MRLHNTKNNLIWKIFIIFIVFSILQKITAFEGIVLFGVEFRIVLTIIMQIFILILLKNNENISIKAFERCSTKTDGYENSYNIEVGDGNSNNFRTKDGKLNNLKTKDENLRNFKTKNKFSKTEIIKDIFLQIIFHILINISAVVLINKIFSLPLNFSEIGEIVNGKSTVQFLCFNLSVIFLAPVIEELVFRDLVFSELYKKYGLILSALISSALFSIFHNKIQIIGAFLFGFSMQLIYMKYVNIFFPILIHMISNFISVIPEINSFFDYEYNINESFVQSILKKLEEFETAGVVLCLFIFLISFVYFYKFIKSYIIELKQLHIKRFT